MRITYETTFTGTCPVDGTTDVYELTITSDKTIPAEAILEGVQAEVREPSFQEDITRRLGQRFIGASVVTRGVHSGVRTTARY